MGDILQFVDSLSATAAVLLDLNDEEPLAVAGFSAPPPQLRRNTAGGSLTDGDLVTADSYGDRTISLTLELFTATQDQNAATLQELARLINLNGAWLKWEPTGMTRPVFFRTKRASMSTVNEIVAATAMREIVIEIPAEPFAYGLEESGTFTIANDVLMHDFGNAVKGDVATPLFTQFLTDGSSFHNIVLASTARTDGIVQTVAYTQSATVGAPLTPPAGWTAVDTADATAITGERRRVARAAAGAYSTFLVEDGSWSTLPRGNFRVMVRARASTVGAFDLIFANGVGDNKTEIRTSVVNGGAVRTGWDWYDLGVITMPQGAPPVDAAFGLGPPNLTPLFFLTVGTAEVMSVDFDELMLVPVGGASGITSAKCAGQSIDAPASSVATVVIDGVNDLRYMFVDDASVALTPFTAITGDIPVLVPGANNTIHLVRTASQNLVGKGQYDDKTKSTIVTFKYFPLYLYTRPATT